MGFSGSVFSPSSGKIVVPFAPVEPPKSKYEWGGPSRVGDGVTPNLREGGIGGVFGSSCFLESDGDFNTNKTRHV